MANICHVLVIPWGVPHLWETANRGISAAQICPSDLSDRPCLGRAENLHQPLLAKPPHALRSFLAAGKEEIKDEPQEGGLELDFMWQHMWPPCFHLSACFVGLSLGAEVPPATCSPCTAAAPDTPERCSSSLYSWEKEEGVS